MNILFMSGIHGTCDNLDDFIKFTETNVEGEIYTVKKESTMLWVEII